MIKGGSFLIEDIEASLITTPEDFSDEQKMIFRTTVDFVEKEVLPRMDEIESQDEATIRSLMKAAADVGLLGADVEEEYGGTDLDKVSSMIIAECMGRGGSFCITHGGQTGIGTLPIVYFGNKKQKEKYLPDIVSGDKISSYALTEPEAGTDAMSIRTRAVLSKDGQYYLLNGSKQFITNAGFADVFVLFAKVDGDKFTAFIVDRDTEGFSMGAEEKKMGLKGSSTRALTLEDAKVPAENLLFEVGKGHLVAFNILNMGRLKIAANALGAAKYALEQAANYANNRKQFKQPIVNFGLIKEKLANMAKKIFVTESMLYRISGLIEEEVFSKLDKSKEVLGYEIAERLSDYVIECSILKIYATETLSYVVDEGVQIHGGYGYIAEYPIERVYRDARIFRIFEGTNEINRIVIPTTIVRKAQKGELPLGEKLDRIDEVWAGIAPPLTRAEEIVKMAKALFLYVYKQATARYGQNIGREQEVLGRLADMAIEVYGMESALLRTQKAFNSGKKAEAELMRKITEAYAFEAVRAVEAKAADVLAMVGEEKEKEVGRVRALCTHVPVDVVALNREIAAEVAEAGGYPIKVA
ncbi:acyl-CoA dehydrogenase family protein [Desulfovirgula thermocuniculi]|uniref:acyl-CoA dehydrogenase family protein n=1 Tax=Desulfovirgula thermocuniculi TaxID=348842 RepID=UPI000425D7DD|nr:acyl-CoA dehydrogenase family protein [Desulfovirgula thermocuniculi]